MKKSNKLLLALGSISSLAALPLIAASCDKNDKPKEETKNNPATSEGTTTNSNSSSSASTSGESTTEREQGDQAAPSLGSAPTASTPNTKRDGNFEFWKNLGSFEWLGAEERDRKLELDERERLGSIADAIKQNSDMVKKNWENVSDEGRQSADFWSNWWESGDE
ncbi:variable surface lipoprotein [Metamycoplasma auris]|uniref:Lipoprotein n=1 Tax=Metamycoplasma auris TaxID=51363 RepID=A0A2W7GPU7_9BACT|nr:variable surface lipoprotein [Metamycoplasma auris]PZV99912.1 hypothetical protein BCF89_10546 [Metamycoplasma auris]